jgi:A118 family predicted phage portal protein
VVRAFGLGTGAFAVWLDVGRRLVRVRHYDARMVVPLSWDAEGVRECAFVTRCFSRGALLDQLQMHVLGPAGTYHIRTVCFDKDGREASVPGVAPEVETGSAFPTFGIVRPAVPNTRVDFSPYGQSVFADAVDAVQSVDLAYDALINEVDAGKMRVFLSDVMFDQERTADGKRVPIPFGKGDCTVFRKVMSTEDTIQEFAPALRTEAQGKAFRLALQVLGDLCGLGTNYFDLDNVGYVKTATEVSSDNSALMRNIRKNENALQGALADVSRAVLSCGRLMGEALPDEGGVSVIYDDSIVQDTAAEKRQDMEEVAAGLVTREEYRRKWYGEASG